MRHGFLDTYANLDSPVHKASARIKIIFVFVFLLLIVLSPPISWLILLYSGIVFLLVYISRIPLNFIFIKIIAALPFILFLSTLALFRKNGAIIFIIHFSKALLAITLVIILSSTTRFNELLKELKNIGLPKLIALLLSFMYRYIFLLEDQFLRTKRGFQSRSSQKINRLIQLKVLSNIIGFLFIRTYERAERVYLAMCARGFNDQKDS